jgi:hypothetical protein
VTQRYAHSIVSGHIGRNRHVNIQLKKGAAFIQKLQKKRTCWKIFTSEHWWEEEDEFDSLTDALRRKLIYVITPGGSENEIDMLRSSLANVAFNAGFCSSEEIEYATKLWAGRDKPPMFLKMRRRMTLDAADRVPQFLEEALQQNWRLDLDAGLGLEEPPAENLLVICSSQEHKIASSLLQACGWSSDTSSQTPLNKIAIITVEGTKAGDPVDWKALSKTVIHVSADSIQA